MSFELIAFDLDGTLIELNLPFDEIRRALGIEKKFILETIMEEKNEQRKKEMLRILEEFEVRSAFEAKAAYFAPELLEALEIAGIVKGVITRNSRKSVDIVVERLGFNFDFIITREDAAPKPSPEPVKLAMRLFDVEAEKCLMVGDFLFDLLAGKRAGAKTALIITEKNSSMVNSFIQYADFVFRSLREHAEFLEVV